MKKTILDKAGEMFLKLGYKSVTMDDIANEMAISKKTLYKYFANKQNLVEESTTQIHQSCLNAIYKITESGFNPIKENFETKKMFREMFKNLGGSPLFQLEKYYPKIYERVVSIEVVTFSECIKNNIDKGIKDGYYRKNINIEACIDFYLSIIFNIHKKDISSLDVLNLEQQALEYHTRAIATQKGVEELEYQLKNTK